MSNIPNNCELCKKNLRTEADTFISPCCGSKAHSTCYGHYVEVSTTCFHCKQALVENSYEEEEPKTDSYEHEPSSDHPVIQINDAMVLDQKVITSVPNQNKIKGEIITHPTAPKLSTHMIDMSGSSDKHHPNEPIFINHSDHSSLNKYPCSFNAPKKDNDPEKQCPVITARGTLCTKPKTKKEHAKCPYHTGIETDPSLTTFKVKLSTISKLNKRAKRQNTAKYRYFGRYMQEVKYTYEIKKEREVFDQEAAEFNNHYPEDHFKRTVEDLLGSAIYDDEKLAL